MDIIISAQKGAGKTTLAQKLLTSYFNETNWLQIESWIFEVPDDCELNLNNLLSILTIDRPEEMRYKGILFDGFTSDQIKQAIWIVSQYRKRFPDKHFERPFIAVYCTQDKAYLV